MTTAASQPGALTLATNWHIDPAHSTAAFAVRHLMISTVRGRFRQLTGTVALSKDDPNWAGVEVTIAVASIDTDQPQRDAHLRSPDFFDAERFPTITFSGLRLAGDIRSAFALTGHLTMHGFTREVTLNVTAEGLGPNPMGPGFRSGYSATTTIDRRDFGLTWNQALETGGVAVGNTVKITIDLELVSVDG